MECKKMFGTSNMKFKRQLTQHSQQHFHSQLMQIHFPVNHWTVH